jgi:hypothetical protein
VTHTSVMQAVRKPTSAAIAGLVFAFILSWVLTLLHGVTPTTIDEFGSWAADPSHRSSVDLALDLMPFAGIAFLWFIAVIRTQLGSREDRFFETVFLGSGLVFVAMLFVSAAILKAPLILTAAGVPVPPETLALCWAMATSVLGQFGARMAAVFILSTATAGVRSGALPRWVAFLGYATGLIMLFIPPLPNIAQFAFPAWVALVSVLVILRRHHPAVPETAA